MIKSIKINNFQSHKNTKLVLDPGVNVIVGLSDSGKSAIIRALRWVVYNRPGGDAFRSTWGGITAVQLEMEHGAVIRRKSEKDNDYAVSHYGDKADFTVLKAIGTNVPEDVQRVLNLQDVNLQLQLDKPFLLDNSPGEVAQHFNKIARLDVIDSSIQVVQRWLRELEQGVKRNETALSQAEEELKQYGYLPEMDARVTALEQIDGQLTGMVVKEAKIQNILELIGETEGDIRLTSRIIKNEPVVNQALELIGVAKEKKEKVDKLVSHISMIQSVQKQINGAERVAKFEAVVNESIQLLEAKDNKLKIKNDLTALIYIIQEVGRGITTYSKTLSEKEKEFKKIFPDICPLCGQEVKK